MSRKRTKIQEPAERKALPMFVQEIENEREVVALNALFGNVDDGWDILHPGAFAKTLQDRFHRVRVLWQHDHWMPPVGVPKWAREIGRDDLPEQVRTQFPDALGGLLSKVEYLDTERGNEVLTGIKAEAINENSIGYDPVVFDFEEVDETQVRNLREVRLWDLSPVNWGMNEGAVTLGFKSVVLPYQDLKLASEDRDWDADAAEGRVREWASDGDEIDWGRYRKAFVLYDRDDPENMVSYKLGVADVVDGELVAVPAAILSAGGALMGARGGVEEFDEGDIEGAKEHLARYYRKMDREAPWEDEEKARAWGVVTALLSAPAPETIQGLMAELKRDYALLGGEELVENASHVLTALIETAAGGEPDGSGPEGKNDPPPAGDPLAAMEWRLKFADLKNKLNL